MSVAPPSSGGATGLASTLTPPPNATPPSPPNVGGGAGGGHPGAAVPPPGAEPRRGIRFGLAAIKNVGEGAVDAILVERARGGPFRSLDDFCRRVDLKALNKRVLESLIKAGALDEFGARERLLAALDGVLAGAQSSQRAEARGQASLFD